MKIKLVSVDEDDFNKFRKNLNNLLEIYNLQSYFPILDDYFNFYNKSNKHFTLRTRWKITQLGDQQHTNNDGYIKHIFNCNLVNCITKKTEQRQVFIKILPLLNVLHYLTHSCNLESSLLPNKYNYLSQKKINNPNNNAYIDVFFSYLASNLTETGACPTFPLFYGTYSGIKENYKFDITEDFDDLSNNESFHADLGNEYSLEEMEFEKNLTVNNELLNSECLISYTSLNDDLDNSSDNDNTGEITNLNELKNELEAESNEFLRNADSLADIVTDSQIEELIIDNIQEEVVTNLDILSETDSNNDSFSDSNVQSDNDSQLDLEKDINIPLNDNNTSGDSDSDEEFNEIFKYGLKKSSLSDIKVIDCDDNLSDISATSEKSNVMHCVNIRQFPIQLNLLEKLDYTLDHYIDNSINKKISPTEWKSILFQICFGLAVGQRRFNFVHNDLHSSNIMFKKTELEYLHFKVFNKYYKVPTFGKITKIIDFGRATFKVNNKIYFSDVFKKNEDAGGQYTYPYQNSLKNCKIPPNKSFDLSRLATTIIQRFHNCNESYSEILELLECWTTDKYGNNLMNLEEDFSLYKVIAKNAKSANPIKQFNKKIWNMFEVSIEDIDSSTYVYKLN